MELHCNTSENRVGCNSRADIKRIDSLQSRWNTLEGYFANDRAVEKLLALIRRIVTNRNFESKIEIIEQYSEGIIAMKEIDINMVRREKLTILYGYLQDMAILCDALRQNSLSMLYIKYTAIARMRVNAMFDEVGAGCEGHDHFVDELREDYNALQSGLPTKTIRWSLFHNEDSRRLYRAMLIVRCIPYPANGDRLKKITQQI